MPHPLGIDLLTVLGMGPVEHVVLAADLGCDTVSIGLTQLSANPHGYPAWSLRDEPVLRRELKAVLRERGVAIAIGEGIGVSAITDVSERAADLDIFAELGVLRVAGADMGVEHGRALDQLAKLCEMTQERAMECTIAFCPMFSIRSLPEALEAVVHVGGAKAGILIDAMHFFRSGGTVRQIAELDPALIGYVQLCDAPRGGLADYTQEAMSNRMIPGAGELPVREFVDALPRGQTLGLQVPLVAAAASGRPPSEYVAEIVLRTRELLT